jgi:hypothetical protein
MASTKVKVSGFEMQFSEGIKINDFFQELESISKRPEIKVGIYSTRVYTRIIDGLAVGLILTFKDDKKKLATEKDGSGKLKVNRIELMENQASTEASLFCFNPSTRSGIFTHYAGSASVSIYTSIFNQAHKSVKNRLIDQKINELSGWGSRGDTKRIRSRAQDEYSGSFSFKHIYQEKDLNQVLDNLKNLSEIEVTTELGIPNEPVFRHLGATAKKTTQTVSFLDQFKSIENLKGHLSNFVKEVFSVKDKKYALKLIGTSLSGQRAQYWLGANVEEYGFFDYDNYIDELPEEVWDDYVSCLALKSLITKVTENSEVFGDISPVTSWEKYSSLMDLSPQPNIPTEGGSLKSMDDFKDELVDPLQIEMCL